MKANLTQVEAARKLGVSQPYLSQLERGDRRVTQKLAHAATQLFGLSAASLPVPDHLPEGGWPAESLPRQLATLSYPGFAHLRRAPAKNPALLMFEALVRDELDARVTEALPWVLAQYPDLDWKWLLRQAKLSNLQNRLGFLVTVARELAGRKANWRRSAVRLREAESDLERARLAAETTLGRESMGQAERRWLRANRSPEAKRWNVLSTMRPEGLPYGA